MQENTNKAIAINSIINYAKMGISTILALLTTRFALQALGVADFGLFSVLGSIISFIGIFNTIMLSTCNRFMTLAIGKRDNIEINRQFNVNLVIFICIAIFLFVVAYPIGDWYVHKYIHYDGPIEDAMMVFTLSILGSVFSTLATPYNGLLMAKERFIVFSSVEVVTQVIRFIVAFLLINHFENKLFIYTSTMAALSALPVIVYWIYCRYNFKEYVRWEFVREKTIYQQVFKFSGWVGYGAIACIARNQGAALLVNAFFNTLMNTALGIANSLNIYIVMFANNLTQPMQPQITKSYAAGDMKRTDELLIMSTKFSFMLMLLISIPFFVDAEYILRVWLREVPAYAVSFTILLIIDNLVQSFNSGISTILFANGRIALYQLIINTLRILAIVVAFFVLRTGGEAYALFYVYITFSVICVFCTQWCLKATMNYDMRNLYLKSYLPSLAIVCLSLLSILLPSSINPIVRITISLLYVAVLEFFIGFSKAERHRCISFIKSKL